MIVGCGIDIVNIHRFSTSAQNIRFLKRFFHPDEIRYICLSAQNATQSTAVRFAAKEAFGKALGTGLYPLTLKEICVKQNKNGKPTLHVYGTTKKKLEENGVNYIHLSLSHEKDYAIAQVILEK
ncbi:MAG: holo-ACP synthase [Spirochaetales bacterium]